MLIFFYQMEKRLSELNQTEVETKLENDKLMKVGWKLSQWKFSTSIYEILESEYFLLCIWLCGFWGLVCHWNKV